jgi:hypothetical protein
MLRTLAILTFALSGCAKKSSPATSNTTSTSTGTEPAEATDTPEPAAGARSAEECTEVLDHVQSVVVEAIDREGMMTACMEEWNDELVSCLFGATDDANVAACWE